MAIFRHLWASFVSPFHKCGRIIDSLPAPGGLESQLAVKLCLCLMVGNLVTVSLQLLMALRGAGAGQDARARERRELLAAFHGEVCKGGARRRGGAVSSRRSRPNTVTLA